MNLLNEKVEHSTFGCGVIAEVNDNKIWVQFQDSIGTKIFVYPDVFEKFLKAENKEVEENMLEECRIKHEQVEQELERIEKEHEAAKLEEKKARLEISRKKSTVKSRKKQSLN